MKRRTLKQIFCRHDFKTIATSAPNRMPAILRQCQKCGVYNHLLWGYGHRILSAKSTSHLIDWQFVATEEDPDGI